MPATKKEEDQKEFHEHRWSRKTQTESFCISFYKGKPCIKLGIGQNEYDRRKTEWEAYFNLCQETPSKRDYEEMRIAYKAQDKEKMAEIKKRVEVRCQKSTEMNEWGDYGFKCIESEYFAQEPSFPYPEHPSLPYVILTT